MVVYTGVKRRKSVRSGKFWMRFNGKSRRLCGPLDLEGGRKKKIRDNSELWHEKL